MFKNRFKSFSFAASAMLAVLVLAACSVSTAKIGSLKLSKDAEGKSETVTFARQDTIFATAAVTNVPSKVTLKWQFITEKVEGQTDNAAIPQFDKSFDFPSDGTSTYNLSPPPDGWPVGKYRIEAVMYNEAGEKKDQKAMSFTVAE